MKTFLEVLRNRYRKTPKMLRNILSPAYFFYHLANKVYDLLRPNAWIIRYNTNKDSDPVNLMYCGDFRDKNYIVRMALPIECTQNKVGRIWVWQLNKFIRRHKEEVDCLIHDVPRLVSLLLGNRQCFYVPIWVQGELDYSIIDFVSTGVKSDIKRASDYTFEVVKGIPQLECFYREMYVPYAMERYGGEYILADLESLILLAKSIELLLIKKNETYIAGHILQYKDGNITFRCIGVKPGLEKLVRFSALQAAYYFTFCYLKGLKYKRAIAGGSRAFLHDGVLSFKKKWGLRLTDCRHNLMRVCVLKNTVGVRNFLVANPCVALEGKDLVAMVFINKDGELTKDDLNGCARYFWPGLKKLVINHFGNSGFSAGKSTDDRNIVVRSAEKLIGLN